jgi:uncharacterized Zn finger protein (UPF0148 family)
MTLTYTFCTRCHTNIEESLLIAGDADNLYCPVCDTLVKKKAPPKKEYALTVDQCTYTIHCLQKQEIKLNHALKQVHDTITTLEILRELAKEKENGI